jgi:heat shock protein HslJ
MAKGNGLGSVVGLVLVLLAACTSSPSPPTQSALVGPIWLATSIDGQAVPAGVWVTAKFDGQHMGGISGCNSYGSDYTASEDGNFRFTGDMVGTAMGCPDPNGTTEDGYLGALQKVQSYGVVRDTLTLSGDSQQPVIAFKSSPETLLQDRMWSVSQYRDGPITDNTAMRTPIAHSLMNLEFANDGTLRGYSGCNAFEMTYRLQGQRMTIKGPEPLTPTSSPPPATMLGNRTCSRELDHQQLAFLSDLGTVWSWEVGMGGQFLMMTGSGTEAVALGKPVVPISPGLP